jgi:pilus assembly protein Flp/PilA
MLGNFPRDEAGATAIEYSLIAGFIALAIIAAVGLTGQRLVQLFESLLDLMGWTRSGFAGMKARPLDIEHNPISAQASQDELFASVNREPVQRRVEFKVPLNAKDLRAEAGGLHRHEGYIRPSWHHWSAEIALWSCFSGLTGTPFRLEPLEVRTESVVSLLASNKGRLGLLASPLFLCLTFFLRGRRLLVGFVIHDRQRFVTLKVPFVS